MAILETYKKAILEQYPKTPNTSGIYILTRKKDNDKCVYVGQSIHILQRIRHMVDYKGYIDTSLSTHGLKSILNPFKRWNLSLVKQRIDCLKQTLTNRKKILTKPQAGQGWQRENRV